MEINVIGKNETCDFSYASSTYTVMDFRQRMTTKRIINEGTLKRDIRPQNCCYAPY